jgi:ParB-like chromosome segregation protein Spo0J
MEQTKPWPADSVERQKLENLIPYARNARTHSEAQIGQIAASIREWGFTVPVLIDEAGMIIAGHGRVLAAAQLGLGEIPVIVARGWSDAQKQAYVIADNQLQLNAGWDEGLLRLEVSELKGLGFEPLLGFSEAELAKLAYVAAPPSEFAEVGENIPTEHHCPRCGYVWSGGSSSRPSHDQQDADAA